MCMIIWPGSVHTCTLQTRVAEVVFPMPGGPDSRAALNHDPSEDLPLPVKVHIGENG